jgi:hypothetical protein
VLELPWILHGPICVQAHSIFFSGPGWLSHLVILLATSRKHLPSSYGFSHLTQSGTWKLCLRSRWILCDIGLLRPLVYVI